MEEAIVPCPFCGERITILVDVSVDNQRYIEDCSVCCRPIEFRVVCEDSTLVSVEVERDS